MELFFKWMALLASQEPFFSPLSLGFTAPLVGQMVHMLFDMFHSRPQVQHLWLTAALSTAMNPIAIIRITQGAHTSDQATHFRSGDLQALPSGIPRR